jgi:flagellar hook-basal body complex protein FliE
MAVTPIQEIRQAAELAEIVRGGSVRRTGGPDFAETLLDALASAGETERTAQEAATRFAEGDPEIGIHEVMIAQEKASIALRAAITLQNKMIGAYKELMNTPL